MKKISIYLMLFLSLFGLSSCKKEKENIEFNKYLDELFYFFLGEDPININALIVDTKKYNLEEFAVYPYDFSLELEEEYFNGLKEVKNKLLNYKKLNKKQELSKKILIDYIDRELAFDGLFYYQSNLGSYLGYQAQLPIILAEYRFDDMYDIECYFEYLKSTKITFANIINFERERIDKKVGMNSKIIDGVIDQIDNFLKLEGYYLKNSFNKKIEEANFLNDVQKRLLISEHSDIIDKDFLDAYFYLKEQLNNLKIFVNDEEIKISKEYYQALFQRATGTDYTIPEAKEYIESKIGELIKGYNIEYRSKYQIELMKQNSFNELFSYYIDKGKNSFPVLPYDVEYEIKTIDESLEENSSPAMYFISPIDANIKEIIYVNNLYFKEKSNYVYQTIAHEGIPGHMYQNVYLKNLDIPEVRKILRYNGYTEGWATYVENYVVGYVDEEAMKPFEFFDALSYLYLGLIDIGINYEGWSKDEAVSFILDTFSSLTNEEALNIYYQLLEVPTNYLEYYFSYFQIQDLKAYFKKKMGKKYSDYLFHKIYLDTGPSPFKILYEQYQNYKL